MNAKPSSVLVPTLCCLLAACSSPGIPDSAPVPAGPEAAAPTALAPQQAGQNAPVDDEEAPDAPILVAAKAGNADEVRRLLDAGADLHARNYCGWTPLHVAAVNKRTEVVCLLLERGAQVNRKDDYDRTPLQYGVHADFALVKLLVDAGADVNSRGMDNESVLTSVGREGGFDPATDTPRTDRQRIIQYLHAHGAKE